MRGPATVLALSMALFSESVARTPYLDNVAAASLASSYELQAGTRRKNVRTYTVQQVKNRISELPESIAADINIDSNMRVTGTFWPSFNTEYGKRNGTILLSYAGNIVLKPGETSSQHSTWQRNYMLISRRAGPHTLVALDSGRVPSDAQTANAFSRDALINYANFVDGEGKFSRRELYSIGRDFGGTSRFYEFLKFVDRLGTQFDGSARFRKNKYGIRRAGRFLGFRRLGFRGYSRGREFSVGAYFIDFNMVSVSDVIDEDYLREFDNDFNSWLSLNGRRQVIRIMSPVQYNRMPKLPGIVDVGSEILPDNLIVILEENR